MIKRVILASMLVSVVLVGCGNKQNISPNEDESNITVEAVDNEQPIAEKSDDSKTKNEKIDNIKDADEKNNVTDVSLGNVDDTFIPASFLEERVKKNFFESSADIIDNLAVGEAYALVNMKNGEEIVLITSVCYEKTDKTMVSYEAIPYYKSKNGYEYGNTPFIGQDEDYPIKLTEDGDIICAGSQTVEKFELVNNENRRGFGYKYSISENIDGDSTSTYSGFTTNFDTEETTDFDEKNGGDFFAEAVKEYAESEPIGFTVIVEEAGEATSLGYPLKVEFSHWAGADSKKGEYTVDAYEGLKFEVNQRICDLIVEVDKVSQDKITLRCYYSDNEKKIFKVKLKKGQSETLDTPSMDSGGRVTLTFV